MNRDRLETLLLMFFSAVLGAVLYKIGIGVLTVYGFGFK